MTLQYWLLYFLPSRSMVSGSSDDVSIATSGGHDKHPSRRSHANQDLVDGSLDMVEDKVQIVYLECTIVVFCIDWYLGTNSACINQQKRLISSSMWPFWKSFMMFHIQVSDLGSNTGESAGNASDNVAAKEEELCQLVINVLFTVMWRGRAGVSGL